jgi:hypothetical protein
LPDFEKKIEQIEQPLTPKPKSSASNLASTAPLDNQPKKI